MYSIGFPKMFTSTKTITVKDYDATASNLKLVLTSNQNGLLGDPQFGSTLTKLLFEQNTTILKELIVDEIYSTIETFMPQLKVKREDIVVTGEDNVIKISITAINLLDYQLNTFNLALTEGYEQ